MIVLALTGSIGMGKSTSAQMFREAGVPVHDADATVHDLYEGTGVPVIAELFPDTIVDGKVDRARLGAIVLKDNDALKRLESVIHPLVRDAEIEFLENARARDEALVVLDIPLLYETGGEARVDGVIVVSCGPEEQRLRVLARPGMTEEKFEAILARQVPDDIKRAKADFIIDSSGGFDEARRQVTGIIDKVRSGDWHPKAKS